jgi:hypothetical protein
VAAAKAKGHKLGGYRAPSGATKAAANRRAEALQPVFAELSALSANEAARGVKRPQGADAHRQAVVESNSSGSGRGLPDRRRLLV